MGLTSSTVTSAPDEYIFVSDTRYHPCGTRYWDKEFSLNACA